MLTSAARSFAFELKVTESERWSNTQPGAYHPFAVALDTRSAPLGEVVPPSKPARRYGSDLVVDLFKQFEIPFAALNPGASYRGLHDSLVNYGGNVMPELILCPHE